MTFTDVVQTLRAHQDISLENSDLKSFWIVKSLHERVYKSLQKDIKVGESGMGVSGTLWKLLYRVATHDC